VRAAEACILQAFCKLPCREIATLPAPVSAPVPLPIPVPMPPALARLRRCVAAVLLGALAAADGASPAAATPAAPPRRPADELFDKSLKASVEALRVYGSWDEPTQLQRVNEIGYRVAQESGFHDYPFSFGLIDMPEPNAFALPAGQIFVTRG